MSDLGTKDGARGAGDDPVPPEEGHTRGHGHWMMIACCVPMLVIAVVLVATGVVSAGFLAIALACTAMMAAMMFVMGR